MIVLVNFIPDDAEHTCFELRVSELQLDEMILAMDAAETRRRCAGLNGVANELKAFKMAMAKAYIQCALIEGSTRAAHFEPLIKG